MSHDEKVAYIVAQIADDVLLVRLLRIAISNQLPNIEDARLDALIAALSA